MQQQRSFVSYLLVVMGQTNFKQSQMKQFNHKICSLEQQKKVTPHTFIKESHIQRIFYNDYKKLKKICSTNFIYASLKLINSIRGSLKQHGIILKIVPFTLTSEPDVLWDRSLLPINSLLPIVDYYYLALVTYEAINTIFSYLSSFLHCHFETTE